MLKYKRIVYLHFDMPGAGNREKQLQEKYPNTDINVINIKGLINEKNNPKEGQILKLLDNQSKLYIEGHGSLKKNTIKNYSHEDKEFFFDNAIKMDPKQLALLILQYLEKKKLKKDVNVFNISFLSCFTAGKRYHSDYLSQITHEQSFAKQFADEFASHKVDVDVKARSEIINMPANNFNKTTVAIENYTFFKKLENRKTSVLLQSNAPNKGLYDSTELIKLTKEIEKLKIKKAPGSKWLFQVRNGSINIVNIYEVEQVQRKTNFCLNM